MFEVLGYEDLGVGLKQLAAKAVAEPETYLVAQERRDDGHAHQNRNVQAQLIAQDCRGAQHGIAGEEREEHAGFNKDNQRNAAERPAAKVLEQGGGVHEVA